MSEADSDSDVWFNSREQARNAAVKEMESFLGWEMHTTTPTREKTKYGVLASVWNLISGKYAAIRYDPYGKEGPAIDVERSHRGRGKTKKTVHYRFPPATKAEIALATQRAAEFEEGQKKQGRKSGKK